MMKVRLRRNPWASRWLVGVSFTTLVLLALAAVSCASWKNQPQSTPTQSAVSATATQESLDEAEAAAKTFVEAWETFDYRDQEGRFNRVLPLLTAERRSQYTAFHENAYARLAELTGTTSVTASRVTDVSGDNVTVAVTTSRFRHFIAHLPGPELIEQSSVEHAECHLIFEDGRWLVAKWQIESERVLPSEATPTPPARTASRYASDPVISLIAEDFIESYSSSIIEDVGASERGRYTDSSGTVWVRFGALSHWYSNNKLVTAPFSGIMKETSDGNWELVAVGTSGVECGIPADVQSALGFLVCPPGPATTAWARDEQEADKAIKDRVLGLSSLGDWRVDDKKFYTDSSGVLWLKFNISPIPNGITDPAYGFIVKVGRNWVGVSGPGTALVECDVPAEVQVAFEHGTCLPHEEELDQAIKDFVKSTAPVGESVIVDRKLHYADSAGTTWLLCGALLTHEGATDQVYCLMKKTPAGDWIGVAGPSQDDNVWCNAPPDALGNKYCL
jgi:hypothetical protein